MTPKHSLLRTLAAGFVAGGVLLPFGVLAVLSLGRAWPYPAVLPEVSGAGAWALLFSAEGGLAADFGLSVGLALVVATLATALGFVTSRAVAYHPRRDRLLGLAYGPFVFSPVVYAACLHTYFIRLGLSGGVAGVGLGQLLVAYPFAVIFFTGFWNDNIRSLENVVLTLGGSPGQAYRRVLLPLARNLLGVCFFQTFLISWFEYGLTAFIGVGRVQTLTVKVYGYISEANPFLAALSSCLLVFPPLVLLWVNKRILYREVVQ
jgi:putative spermidine/putrescine transport system permease protein